MTHYNDKGQVDYREDTAGNRTTFAYYSESGRRKWKENPLGKKTYFAYNDRGKVIRKWGDTPYPVEQVYDEHGRRIKLKTYRNGSGWDGSSWPSETGDADVTTWIYEAATGLLERKEYDDGKGTDYTYDIAGRLKTRTWARTDENGDPIVTTYNYDPATGNLLSTDYSDDTPDITYTYTRTGQKKTVTDAAGQRSFSYNEQLQRKSEALPEAFYGDKVLTNKYEDSTGPKPGRDKGFKLGTSTDPDADMEITYGYDDKGRLNAVTDSNGTYTYSRVENSNMIATTTHPNGLKRTRAYESERNVVDYVENTVNDTTISKYNYTNDAAGKRTDVERTGTAFSQSDEISYDYNSRSEVTGAESTADDNYDYNYAYDNIGNRRSSGNEVNSYLTWNRDYAANNLNQYESVNNELELSTRRWEQTFDWDTEPDHDVDGNMTYLPSFTGNWNLTWNAENRLVKAVSPGTKLEFTYDYKGRRIQKKVYTRDDSSDLWSLTSDLRYIYNGWNLIATTKTTDGSQPSSFAKASEDTQLTVKTYTWGLDLSGDRQGAGGVGGLLSVTRKVEQGTRNAYYVSYDANGNVSEYIDGSGNTVAHYEYSPFGRLTAATGDKAADFHYRFSTKYQNNETGLYYYGFRYYSAELGRWLSRDPIGERGRLNRFLFSGNNMINSIDVLGLVRYKKIKWYVYETSSGTFRKSRFRIEGSHYKGSFTEKVKIPEPEGEQCRPEKRQTEAAAWKEKLIKTLGNWAPGPYGDLVELGDYIKNNYDQWQENARACAEARRALASCLQDELDSDNQENLRAGSLQAQTNRSVEELAQCLDDGVCQGKKREVAEHCGQHQQDMKDVVKKAGDMAGKKAVDKIIGTIAPDNINKARDYYDKFKKLKDTYERWSSGN